MSDIVYKVVQIHGSMDYPRETHVECMYRDARVPSVHHGASEGQRMIIARDLLAAPAGARDSSFPDTAAASSSAPAPAKGVG